MKLFAQERRRKVQLKCLELRRLFRWIDFSEAFEQFSPNPDQKNNTNKLPYIVHSTYNIQKSAGNVVLTSALEVGELLFGSNKNSKV